MIYPSGRALNYKYGTSGGTDDALSRVSSLVDSDGVTHLADYTRLGLNTFVQLAYAQAATTWSLINGTGADPYTGFDQFNRVVDNRWFNSGTNADLDRIQHGYDRASNRLWRRNTVADAASANLDELYGYDALHRLAELQRGQLNVSNNGIVSGTLNVFQAWGLDATGNWSTFQEYDPVLGASTTLTDNRTHNKVNEITSRSLSGPVTYDAAGNTTTCPVSYGGVYLTNMVYDAWNRWIGIPSNFDADYVYDGLGRLAADRDSLYCYYYSDSWQLIEQRFTNSSSPDEQFVWGLRYIDDLVLRDSADYTPTRLYALQDSNWNTSAIIGPTGAVQERYAYDGYGSPHYMAANFALVNGGTQSNFFWETLFAGYRYSPPFGFYLVRNRWYSPLLGRWLTRDPLASGTNLYEYVASAPLDDTDPSGLIQGTGKYRCCSRSAGSGWKIVTVRIWRWNYPRAEYRISRDIERAQDVFEQCCIKLNIESRDVRDRTARETKWVFGFNKLANRPVFDFVDPAALRRFARQTGRVRGRRGVNVHYVPAISGGEAGVTYTFPETTVLIAPVGQTGLPSSRNTLAHEIGHVFDLPHEESYLRRERLMVGSVDEIVLARELTPRQREILTDWINRNYGGDMDLFRRDLAANAWRLTPDDCNKIRSSPLARDPWRGN